MTALENVARARPRGLTAEAVLIGRALRHSARDLESLLMAIALPVMLMLLFTFVFGGAIDPTGGYVDYVVPGTILICAGYGASTTATFVATDMQSGIFDRLRTMPLRPGSVLAGHVVASLVRNAVATVVVIGVSALIGFRAQVGLLGWLTAAGTVALWILAITYLFAAIGLAASSPESAGGYGFVLLFLPYLSSAFVPLNTMPNWLATLCSVLPVTPVVETIRAALTATDAGANPLHAALWCVGILVVAACWGAWLFRHAAARS